MDNVKSKHIFLERSSKAAADLFSVSSQDPGEGSISATYISPVDGHKNDLLWVTTTGYTQPSCLNLANASTMIKKDAPVGEYKMKKLKVRKTPQMHPLALIAGLPNGPTLTTIPLTRHNRASPTCTMRPTSR